MTDWLRRAQAEIPKGPTRPTANSDVRTLSALLAVPHPNPSGKFRRFQVNYADGVAFEARTLPEATQAEAMQLWPGAQIQPLPEDAKRGRRATPSEEAEIRRHIAARLSGHPDYAEALAFALANPQMHLDGFRADEAEATT